MFITYTHPSELQDKERRRLAASYSAKRAAKPQGNYILTTKHPKGMFRWKLREDAVLEVDPNAQIPIRNSSISDIVLNEEEASAKFKISWVNKAIVSSVGSGVDPFSSFPVEAKGYVPKAINYFCQVFAPTQGPAMAEKEGENPILTSLFPLALQHKSLFHGIVAFTLSSVTASNDARASIGRAMWHHRGEALQSLHTRLGSLHSCADDASIHTVLTLMAIDFLVGDVQYVYSHLQGLRHMVKLRGGLDSLHLSGYLRKLITITETMCNRIIASLGSSLARMAPKTALEYPEHPFPPRLCSSLTTLPEGFRETALTRHISVQMIEVLRVFQACLDDTNSPASATGTSDTLDQIAHLNFEMHQAPILDDLTDFEKCICLALSTYRHSISNAQYSSPLLQKFLQAISDTQWADPALSRGLMQAFSSCVREFEDGSANAECLIWVAIVIAGSTLRADLAAFELRKTPVREVYDRYQDARDWASVQSTLRKFFWDDALAAEWHAAWDEISNDMN